MFKMKRFHVNVAVKNMDESIAFYNDLFNQKPIVLKDNYAKWALDDPAVNFSIVPGKEGKDLGVDHLGIQFAEQCDVASTIKRLETGKHNHHVQGDVECCYSRSNKVWSSDPQNVKWEHFVTYGDSEKFDDDDDVNQKLWQSKSSCCG